MRTDRFLTRGVALALSLGVAACSSGAASRGQASSAQLQQLCVGICSKSAQCGDGGASPVSCSADCADAGTALFAPGCNVNQLVSAENSCLTNSCATYASCIETAAATAACATASAGSSADAGASCSLCDQAGTCCAALAELFGESDASACTGFSTAACNEAGAQSAGFAEQCQTQLTVGGQDYGVAVCN